MRQQGNAKSNAYYNPNEVKHPPPANMIDSERDSELEVYIRGTHSSPYFSPFVLKYMLAAKYQSMRFVARAPKPETQSKPEISSTRRVDVHPRRYSPSQASSTTPPTPPAKPDFSRKGQSYRNNIAITSSKNSSSSAWPVRTVSLPQSASPDVKPEGPPPPPPKVPSSNPIWNDLLSLQGPTSTASLPLQYQSGDQQASMPHSTNNPYSINTSNGSGPMAAYAPSAVLTAGLYTGNPFVLQSAPFAASPSPNPTIFQAQSPSYAASSPAPPFQQPSSPFQQVPTRFTPSPSMHMHQASPFFQPQQQPPLPPALPTQQYDSQMLQMQQMQQIQQQQQLTMPFAVEQPRYATNGTNPFATWVSGQQQHPQYGTVNAMGFSQSGAFPGQSWSPL